MRNIMLAFAAAGRGEPGCRAGIPSPPQPGGAGGGGSLPPGSSQVHLIDPLPADEMHNLMARCYLVLTDSGGLQEEAPALGKPVLVLRRETERPEAVEAGTVKLAGVVQDDIVTMAQRLIQDRNAYAAMAHAVNPYGDGQACRRLRMRFCGISSGRTACGLSGITAIRERRDGCGQAEAQLDHLGLCCADSIGAGDDADGHCTVRMVWFFRIPAPHPGRPGRFRLLMAPWLWWRYRPPRCRPRWKTLARPEAYRRTVTVEQLWSGGSSSYEIAMAVSGPGPGQTVRCRTVGCAIRLQARRMSIFGITMRRRFTPAPWGHHCGS